MWHQISASSRLQTRPADPTTAGPQGRQHRAVLSKTRRRRPPARRATLEWLERRTLLAGSVVVAFGGTATLADVDEFSDRPGESLVIDPGVLGAATGPVTIRATNSIVVQDPVILTGSGVSLTLESLGSLSTLASVTSSGNVAFSADRMSIGAPVAAPGRIVTLQPSTPGAAIDLGSATD